MAIFDFKRIRTQEKMAWVAFLRDGTQIYEGESTGIKPNGEKSFSTDFLPADDVVCIGYLPVRNRDITQIFCNIDVDAGERFVRFWTSIKPLNSGGEWLRLYALGWSKIINGKQSFSLLYYYPEYDNIVLTDERYACPPYEPKHDILSKNAIVISGVGYRGWSKNNEKAFLIKMENGYIFESRNVG